MTQFTQTSHPVATALAVRGPLTYSANRALAAPRAKTAGTLRVTLIGDSMTYGAGLPYRRSLAARLAAHLNGAMPDVWADCVSLGVQGGCLYHAAGRVITHALPLEPDIVALCLCHNDAVLLGQGPDGRKDLGREWVMARSMMRTGLKTFRRAVETAGRHALVVYHDWLRQAGEVCLPDELSAACADIGLPFIDGSAALTGYQPRDLWVSEADLHVNAFGTDVIARQIGQFIMGRKWAEARCGFADASWIDAIERAAEARVAAGLSPALALGEALSVLEGKWMHRRNASRRSLEGRYESARRRLLDQHRDSLIRLSLEVAGRALRTNYPLASLMMGEIWANEAMAISFAFEHATTAAGDPILEHLNHIALDDVPGGSFDMTAAAARWQRVGELAASLRHALSGSVTGTCAAGHETADLEFVLFWTSRVAQWCYTVERCAERYVEWLPKLPDTDQPNIARLAAYVDGRARGIFEMLETIRPAADVVRDAGTSAARLAGADHLMFELVMTAAPGSGVWTFNVGMESVAPAFTERQLGCGYLIRDGKPHSYELDLPLMLFGDVHVRLDGVDIAAHGGVQLHSARLRCPRSEQAELPLPPMTVTAVTPDSADLVYRGVLASRSTRN